MANSCASWSSRFPLKLLPWIQLAVVFLILGTLTNLLGTQYTSNGEATAVLIPSLKHSIHCNPRRCRFPVVSPQIPRAVDGGASVLLGFVDCMNLVASSIHDARCPSIEPHFSFKRCLQSNVVPLVTVSTRCKKSFRCNDSVFALPRNEGHAASAQYLCGGLPRACLASSLVMPGNVHMDGRYGAAPREGSLASYVDSASARGVASCAPAESKHGSAPLAVRRGDNWLSASADGDDRSTAATAAGHLLEKARMVQATASGLFCILPLGFRVLKKIEAVCHQELAGMASPLSLPNIMPIQWLQNSDRVRSFGPSLYTVQDRRARQFFLPPTSEEGAAWLAASGIRSHRDLPQVFYQIGPKFRDEARPRAGCLRAREFVMLEVYSFHTDAMCRDATYRKMDDCFRRIFTRVGAGPVYRVLADPGAMGGPCSHEYHVCSILGSDQAVPGLDTDISRKDAYGGDAKDFRNGMSLEVGHCFQLPDTYCKAAGVRFTDSQGALRMPLMNSYGLGVSRLLAHLALMHRDSKGLLFPPQVAPFCVAILPQPAARWNDGRRAARLGKALFRMLHMAVADIGGPADVLLDDRQGLTLRQMQSHADLVGIPHQLIIKEDMLRTPCKARVLYISRVAGAADILPLRAALSRLKSAIVDVAVSSKR